MFGCRFVLRCALDYTSTGGSRSGSLSVINISAARLFFKYLRLYSLTFSVFRASEYMGEVVFEFSREEPYTNAGPCQQALRTGESLLPAYGTARSQEAPIPALSGNRAEKALRFPLKEAS